MDSLYKQVRSARRRLTFQQFLSLLPWCCFGMLILASLLTAADKHWQFWNFSMFGYLGVGLGAGFALAIGLAMYTQQTITQVAVEVDKRYGLKARISSALNLEEEQLDSQFGQALLEDAIRKADRINVADEFQYSVRKTALLPVLPMVLILLFGLFIPPVEGKNSVEEEKKVALLKKDKEKAMQELKDKFEKLKKEAEKEGHNQTAKKIQDLIEKMNEDSKDVKSSNSTKDQLVKFNDYKKELEERQKQLQDANEIQKKLQGLPSAKDGAAKKLADAMKKGEFDKAAKELERLKKELQNGNLSKEKKEQLAQQFQKMQQAIKNMQQMQQQQKQQQLSKQLSKAQQQNDAALAKQLQQQMQNGANQTSAEQKMSQLAKQLGQLQESLKNGDNAAAQQQMQQLQQQMQQLQQQMAENQMLQKAQQQLQQAKCKACNQPGQGQGKQGQGQGMGQGQKQGMGQGQQQLAQGQGQGKGQRLGQGNGQGPGGGPRGLEKDKTGSVDSAVKQKEQGGAQVFVGFDAQGPINEGEVTQKIQENIAQAKSEKKDPLENERLPAGHREQVKQFFDKIREGN